MKIKGSLNCSAVDVSKYVNAIAPKSEIGSTYLLHLRQDLNKDQKVSQEKSTVSQPTI